MEVIHFKFLNLTAAESCLYGISFSRCCSDGEMYSGVWHQCWVWLQVEQSTPLTSP